MSLSDRVLLPDGVKPILYNLELVPDLTAFTFKGFDALENVLNISY
jgi:hypothetical protein